ncbi:hypothetical protein [Nitrospirillum amazonense]|uniref:hypothetical protein n=1 Tax=Nitrospirillum amazonense TaxID=28077 RepID=UPI0024124AEC|nr:hypothetical protein [Nitrospirillum amazonense]MDG3444322.1 hypothetical protein [Nitrospirillum amazonense]
MSNNAVSKKKNDGRLAGKRTAIQIVFYADDSIGRHGLAKPEGPEMEARAAASLISAMAAAVLRHRGYQVTATVIADNGGWIPEVLATHEGSPLDFAAVKVVMDACALALQYVGTRAATGHIKWLARESDGVDLVRAVNEVAVLVVSHTKPWQAIRSEASSLYHRACGTQGF